MLVGCSSYFKVSTTYGITQEQLEISKEDYIIVHIPSGESYCLDHLIIDAEKNEVTGVKKMIDSKHYLLPVVSPKRNKYYPMYNPRYDELHIYATANDQSSLPFVKILLEDISKVEVYNHQTGVKMLERLGVGVGLTVGLGLAVLASSCPFIYTLDENNYNFRGEVYGGAIAPNLERDDYMPLPYFTSKDSVFKLKITNELEERQYTDVAELLMVEHANDMEVLMDSYGAPYSLKHTVSPRSAQTDLGNDYLSEINTHDGVAYQFLDETIENKDFSSIDLSFISTGTTNQMKLVLNLKNTLWLDHMFERFGSLMGDLYDRISSNQNSSPAEQKIQWSKDEGIMLAVKLKTDEGWRTIDYINTVGPFASRSIVVPIEADCQAGDEIIVRLESGYHFWEVDYAAMDFTSNDPLEITRLPLLAAVDENNMDLMSVIAYHDGTYLEQPYIGAEAILTFDGTPTLQSQKSTTLFLHTRGYYEYIRDYTGKPNITELKKFRVTGTFARFAKTRFSQIAGLDN